MNEPGKRDKKEPAPFGPKEQNLLEQDYLANMEKIGITGVIVGSSVRKNVPPKSIIRPQNVPKQPSARIHKVMAMLCHLISEAFQWLIFFVVVGGVVCIVGMVLIWLFRLAATQWHLVL